MKKGSGTVSWKLRAVALLGIAMHGCTPCRAREVFYLTGLPAVILDGAHCLVGDGSSVTLDGKFVRMEEHIWRICEKQIWRHEKPFKSEGGFEYFVCVHWQHFCGHNCDRWVITQCRTKNSEEPDFGDWSGPCWYQSAIDTRSGATQPESGKLWRWRGFGTRESPSTVPVDEKGVRVKDVSPEVRISAQPLTFEEQISKLEGSLAECEERERALAKIVDAHKPWYQHPASIVMAAIIVLLLAVALYPIFSPSIADQAEGKYGEQRDIEEGGSAWPSSTAPLDLPDSPSLVKSETAICLESAPWTTNFPTRKQFMGTASKNGINPRKAQMVFQVIENLCHVLSPSDSSSAAMRQK